MSLAMAPRIEAVEAPAAGLRVALVYMPFAITDRPSIQLGLLSAILRERGHDVDCFHLNLELAARLPEMFNGLCTFRGHMTGEWLFSVAAFGADAHPDDAAYYKTFPSELRHAAKGGVSSADLSRLRHELLPAFIEDCATATDWRSYDVVGFSSTFQQNAASLALARRIKAAAPGVRIVFGGANMEGEMGPEYARAFPFIDHVVSGEGDRVFPDLLDAIGRGEATPALRGVTNRCGEDVIAHGHAAPVRDMDALPVPDFAEYFQRHRQLGLAAQQRYFFALPFESSRGCWWGEKHHCTFCGLNGDGMGYRRKSAERVLRELAELSSTYGVTMFQSTDNIMDMGYLDTLFPAISEQRHDYHFFYEVKSNLTKEHIRRLHAGGVRWIQPGIESLNTEVLRLMRKGCDMLQNVRLLKWALYYRIRVGWNLIWGFPGETAIDYMREHEVLRCLPHLEPPNAACRIWMERFSPIFFDRERFPAARVHPERSYAFVYPPHVDLGKVAYFFDYALEDTAPEETHEATEALVASWQERWHSDRRPQLAYRRTASHIYIDDTRWPESAGTHSFSGPVAAAYEHCSETMRTVRQVAQHLAGRCPGEVPEEAELREVLDLFCERGLMLEEGGRYLALALPINPHW